MTTSPTTTPTSPTPDLPTGTETPFLPFAKPTLGAAEQAAVADALASGWVTIGPKTGEFEKAFAAYTGAPEAVAMNSCTAALHLALVGLGVGPGDEVVTSPLTFAATGNVIAHTGARPVFADVDEQSWNLDPEAARRACTERTKAIIIVHYAGLPAEMGAFRRLADERGLALIEDAAHAVGTMVNGRQVGADSEVACFSFYANKNMTTGEGGMLTTTREDVAACARTHRLHGLSRDAWRRYMEEGSWRYDVVGAGFKYNMNDIAAAMGLVQLGRLESFLEARRRIVERYREDLSDLAGLSFQREEREGERHAHHIFAVRLRRDAGAPPRDEVIRSLKAGRIGFSVHFLPLHLMKHYREQWGYGPGRFPITEALGEELLSLPLFPEMTEDDVDRVVASVRTAW
jgi:dTDP-4-amino-4,6-dideoxygalactose transaminase